ncbi:aspartate aminotransferase family protein [Proteinivorax hydrogeniformans]|uniref:Aspartate aminotransferase family protein n=1 Tax=Proteinivorax hydrogeniformans TaxID=1826727 RepID=A0AAU8HQY2_9FIRM
MGEIFSEDKDYILNLYNRNNLHIKKADGCYLYDESGKKYLDMFSGIAVNNLGQKHQEVTDAILRQLECYSHLSNFFVSEPVVNLAKLLVNNSFASKVFFSNSGAEANEAAIKLARKYGRSKNSDKTEIVTFYNSFHGRTTGGMTLTGQPKYKDNFAPVLPQIKHVRFNDLTDIESTVSNKTCAVFIELIQGEGGIRELSSEYVRKLKNLAEKHDFLIIIDEIQTGLCRTGEIFAHQEFNLTPDVVTIAKALGGGLPLGAMLVNEKLENVLVPGDHGSTFGGNPVACAAGEAVLQVISEQGFKNEVKTKGRYLVEKLNGLKEKYPNVILDIRGKGLMIGLDVGEQANIIKQKAFSKGLLLNVTSGSVVRLLPPLIISFNQIDEFTDKLEFILEEL